MLEELPREVFDEWVLGYLLPAWADKEGEKRGGGRGEQRKRRQ